MMISEGSREDWCKDAENSALHHRIKDYFVCFKKENSYFK